MQTVNLSTSIRQADAALDALVSKLELDETALALADAVLYHDFPVYRDDAGDLLKSQLLIISPQHGLLLVAVSNVARVADHDRLGELDARLDQLFSTLYSRLLRSKALQQTRTALAFPVRAAIYAPNVPGSPPSSLTNDLLQSLADVEGLFQQRLSSPLSPEVLVEIQAVVEGAKGLTRPKARHSPAATPNSLATIVSKVESGIATFDIQQREGYITEINGPQRIRGLAGSGKTVVLAMKAALTHLRDPEATILYTFYTKSLYQHIKRSITRFYRQFDDRDPDWDRIRIQHGWGGAAVPGVYYETCLRAGVDPMTFDAASRSGAKDPFDYACSQLLSSDKVPELYDFVLIDEGQDFPASFVRLCAAIAKDRRFVLAYDDLQTIFRPSTPTPSEIFGTTSEGQPLLEFEDDIVLHKCYRNPREVLVAAHAVGFGIYSEHIVQMLENERHWEDIGYRVVDGTFAKGSHVSIERPRENSPTVVSDMLPVSQIVSSHFYQDSEQEVVAIVQDIKQKLTEGLRPDDILVACVDDRYAKHYLRDIEIGLVAAGLHANNIHADRFGMSDFYKDDNVTLSTVHKAKGNEAFVVYVVGVDALFVGRPGVRERNVLFTAMTRAKGIVRISGCGIPAHRCAEEIKQALDNCPWLKFTYPGAEEMKRIRRDWKGRAVRRKRDAEARIDQLLHDMSPDEILEYIHRGAKARRPSGPGGNGGNK